MDLAPRATIRRARGAGPGRSEAADRRPPPGRAEPPWALAGAAAVVVAGVVLRFGATGALWLDEALAVNIARLPLSDLPEALRHDGAPPLYYLLLHGWTAVFGDGVLAARSLSGVLGVATLPLAWAAGRRLGGRPAAGAALLLVASSPFAVRYATEARMYALVILLVLAGHLAVVRALEDPSLRRLAAVSAATGLLVLTHYWGLFVAAAVTAWLALDARRPGAGARPARRTLASVAVGVAALAPWLPVLAYQTRHTGTPWAVPPGVFELRDALVDFAGGYTRAGTALVLVLVALVALALLGRPTGRRRVELGGPGQPGARPLAFVAAATLGAAFAVAQLTGSAFTSRYASVALPPFLLLAGLGATALWSATARRGALALAVALGLVGAVDHVGDRRTQADQVAGAIRRLAEPGDVVAYCPDQLGPAVSRLLPPAIRQVTYPDLAPPQRVDWADYAARVRASPPRRFAARLLAMAGPGGDVFVVWGGGYRTLGRRCEALVAGLDTRRAEVVVVRPDGRAFERMTLVRFPSRAGAAPASGR
ncbi:MAG: glycosyltransferase family 39 protein [Acidimicrobiia bacterium]